MRCGSACRDRRCLPIGLTATPRAVLVLGRHRKATASLGLLFKHGKISKTYWAVVEGGPTDNEGTVDIPLGRLNEERGWWQKPDPNGLLSITKWKVLGRSSLSASAIAEAGVQFTWLSLEPVTGRTHQLRVHCAAMGWPIAGDNIYGTQASLRRLHNEQYIPRFGEPSLHLHAREIAIPLSKTKPPVVVTATAPAHLHALLKACGWNEK